MTRALIGLGILLLALLYLYAVGPAFVPTGDQAAFALLGRALHEGAGYVDVARPYDSPHTKFPPGFPGLLSLVNGWPRENPLDFRPEKGLVALLGLLGGGLVYLLCRRTLDAPPRQALLVAVLTTLNARYFFLAHSMMSEIPYLVASLPLLLFAHRLGTGRGRGPWDLVLTLLFLLLTLSLRLAGVALVAAIGAFLLVGRFPDTEESPSPRPAVRLLRCGLVVAFALTLLAVWVGRNQSVSDQGLDYLPQLFSAGERALVETGEEPGAPAERLTARFTESLGFYAQETRNLLFLEEETVSRLGRDGVRGIASLLVSGTWIALLLLIGFVFLVRLVRERSLDAFYVLFTLLLVSVWPWRTFRLILPVLPLLLFYLVHGAFLCGERLEKIARGPWVRTLPYLVLVPVLLINGVGAVVVTQGGNGRAYGGQNLFSPAGDFGFYLRDYRDLAEVSRAAAVSADGSTRLLCSKPEVVHLWSGLPSVPFIPTGDPDRVLEQIERHGITLLLIDPLKPNPLRPLLPRETVGEETTLGDRTFRLRAVRGRTRLYDVETR